LCLLTISSGAFAQNSRVYTDSLYTYTLNYDSATSGKYTQCVVKSIAVSRIGSAEAEHTVTPDENIVSCDWLQFDFFLVEDMNFDGRNDFRLLLSMSPGGNTSYAYWLYNASTKAFERSGAFEDSLVNVTFDKEKKLIKSYWSGGTEYGNETYKLVKGKLAIVERSTVTPEESGTTHYIRTVYKPVNGVMKKSSTERLTEEQFQNRE
jgi:hypothetical protein